MLVVDDDVDSREAAAEWLAVAGFDVSEAGNGLEAITDALRRKPDLILMDLEMPEMGGLEAIRQLKSDWRTRAIPVVVLSANESDDHLEARRAGCAASLLKPCDPDQLENTLRALLDASSQGARTTG